eukprot:14484952-Alexandrium_andersonii.AAC.1
MVQLQRTCARAVPRPCACAPCAMISTCALRLTCSSSAAVATSPRPSSPVMHSEALAGSLSWRASYHRSGCYCSACLLLLLSIRLAPLARLLVLLLPLPLLHSLAGPHLAIPCLLFVPGVPLLASFLILPFAAIAIAPVAIAPIATPLQRAQTGVAGQFLKYNVDVTQGQAQASHEGRAAPQQAAQ